jgi:hypothetical protein
MVFCENRNRAGLQEEALLKPLGLRPSNSVYEVKAQQLIDVVRKGGEY